ncbi:MAG: hypothetical protein O7C75_01420 [Verrucomicrobia bacterium]|nr:hypothetical protein [Verrucomicrobiota bacterium]
MKRLIIFVTVIAACNCMQGQNAVSLLENSPFMPPNKGKEDNKTTDAGPASLARLQLRGITSIDGEYIFSVYNPDTRESKWIPKGVEEGGLVIKSYDPVSNSVVIHSESENLSRQMQMNDYAAPTALRATPTLPRSTLTRARAPAKPAVTPTGTLTRTLQSVQRPTRRNLETLRERRAELAEKLRKQPKPGSSDQKKPQVQNQGGKR